MYITKLMEIMPSSSPFIKFVNCPRKMKGKIKNCGNFLTQNVGYVFLNAILVRIDDF